MRAKLILLAFLLDQFTKYLTIIYQPDLKFKGVGLLYSESKGYMLGLFMVVPYRRWLVILIMLFFLFMIQLLFRFYWRVFRRNRLTYMSFSFIVGGFLGNFMDCIISEYVIDIFRVPFVYATNLADGFIFVGLGLLLLEFSINKNFWKTMFKLKPVKEELRLVRTFFKFPKFPRK